MHIIFKISHVEDEAISLWQLTLHHGLNLMPNLICASSSYGRPVLVLFRISYPASLNPTDLISLIQESLLCFPHVPEITMVHWDDGREVSWVKPLQSIEMNCRGHGNWYLNCHPLVVIQPSNGNVSTLFTRSYCWTKQTTSIRKCAVPLCIQ